MARHAAPTRRNPPAGATPSEWAAGRDTPDRSQPLYLTISETLKAEIASGRYPVDSMLPTETELCRQFGVSRFTVREALRRLTEIGLVQRRAGAGSIILASTPPKKFVHRVDSIRSLLRHPENTYRQRLSAGIVHADREIAEQVGCEAGSQWYRISAVRRSDDARAPICSVDFYVLPELGEHLEIPDTDREPVYDHIERHFGIEVERTEISVFASAIREPLSEVVEVAPGTPALTMIRKYTDRDGRLYLFTVAIHPEHRFVYTLELTRDS